MKRIKALALAAAVAATGFLAVPGIARADTPPANCIQFSWLNNHLTVTPGEQLSFPVWATDCGSAPVTAQAAAEDWDPSADASPWIAITPPSANLAYNQTAQFTVQVQVPDGAQAGTTYKTVILAWSEPQGCTTSCVSSAAGAWFDFNVEAGS